ncbi:VOC family protein [Rhodococcus sp. G-MC3]|uniref:VOC family protein n=1 Tax=Rhodococcus sp. G-MC3 TaxID=3046209 RepID=UPI0024B8C923|nr:VOC family protein [Rhodococcus sp. G-MC3]MDJ0395115.1 VOC family protein [Rhodococcus sp. G-MC3]
MATRLNPYLNFRGNARQAMEFYETVFGGELTLNTFADFGASEDPAEKDQIMHGQLVSPSGLTLMAADTPASMSLEVGDNISVSLSGEDEAELSGYWDKLAVGAQNAMGLNKAPWGDTFGMLTDKFGINWLVNISA